MYPIKTPSDRVTYFRELAPVIRHIEKSFRQNISMSEMASVAGLSATQFNVRFRELLRMTPSEYLLRLRLESAKQLLTQTSMSIGELAAEVGFYDQSHFTKRFRRVTGMTPLQFRKRFR